MKEFFCNVCKNTGSAHDDGQMDCIAPGCTAAQDRTAFNRWLLREGYGHCGIKEWGIYRHAVHIAVESCSMLLDENERLRNTIAGMQSRTGGLLVEKAEAAAPAAPVVTVDTMEFRGLLGTLLEASNNDSDEYGAARTPFIAHIDAHTAQAVAAAVQRAYANGITAGRNLEMVDRAAAPQQHAQALPKWIDDQKGKDPLIDSLIAYIEGHPVQQHAQAAQPAKQYGLAAYAQANADSRVTGNAQAVQIDPVAEMLVRAGEVPKDAERMAEDGRAQAALSDAIPPLPELDTSADMEHLFSTPTDWDDDYRNTWKKLQVAERNKMQWRVYALKLRAILAASKQPAAAPSDGKLPPPADGERSMFEREMLRLDICDDEYMIRRHDGSYVDDCDQAAWMAWQAGRLVSETRSIIIKSDEFLVTFKPKDVTEVVWKGPCISPVAPDGESWQHKCEETERALQYWKAKATQLEVTPVAATPPTPPQEAAALADTDQVPYLIVYDDVDQPAEPVIGGTRARYRFKQISGSWNAHLYAKIASNSRDERYPSASLAAPAAQVAVPYTDVQQIVTEVNEACAKWPRFNSAHEGFAVLKEEVDELWDHVKINQKRRNLDEMKKEAKQVAAMALRFMRECCDEITGRK